MVSRRGGGEAGSRSSWPARCCSTPAPVADLVRAGIRERFEAAPAEAHDGAAGAAALAIAALTGAPAGDMVHARLTAAG